MMSGLEAAQAFSGELASGLRFLRRGAPTSDRSSRADIGDIADGRLFGNPGLAGEATEMVMTYPINAFAAGDAGQAQSGKFYFDGRGNWSSAA